MGDEADKDVVQLADQLAEGFTALTGEYQALFDQQKQLESKLSWAKQQVSCEEKSPHTPTPPMMIHLALDLQPHGFDRQQPHVILTFFHHTTCHATRFWFTS
jgi:hypothetical protein